VTYPADLDAPIEALTQELLYERSMGRAKTLEEAVEMFIEPIHDGETYFADFVPERWQVMAAWSEVMELAA
jgi:hypothetical protein